MLMGQRLDSLTTWCSVYMYLHVQTVQTRKMLFRDGKGARNPRGKHRAPFDNAPVQVIVDLADFLQIDICNRFVALRAVVVIETDEILHAVVWEKLLEFGAQLRSKYLRNFATKRTRIITSDVFRVTVAVMGHGPLKARASLPEVCIKSHCCRQQAGSSSVSVSFADPFTSRSGRCNNLVCLSCPGIFSQTSTCPCPGTCTCTCTSNVSS